MPTKLLAESKLPWKKVQCTQLQQYSKVVEKMANQYPFQSQAQNTKNISQKKISDIFPEKNFCYVQG